MAHNPVQVLSKYTSLYGDTFRFYFGGVKEAIVTTNPVVIQHVLKTNWENYHKSHIQKKRMGHFLGKGLLTTEGEAWKTQRRLIQSGFERKQLEVLSSIMQDSLAESLRDFDRQARIGPVDIYPVMMKMTFAMVGKSLFGANLKEDDIDLISEAILTVQEFMVRQTIQPYLNPWFAISGEQRRHEEMRSRAFGVLGDYIRRRREEEPGHDLLQILMDARYSDGTSMRTTWEHWEPEITSSRFVLMRARSFGSCFTAVREAWAIGWVRTSLNWRRRTWSVFLSLCRIVIWRTSQSTRSISTTTLKQWSGRRISLARIAI